VPKLPDIFPGVSSVLDYGGGLGAYLISFRDAGVANLTLMEPLAETECVFKGLRHDPTNLVTATINSVVAGKYELVMCIEVLEHIPAEHHPHLVNALSKLTSKWIFFSAASPKQPGEGHIEESMKTREQWQRDFTASGQLELDPDKTLEVHQNGGNLIKSNSFVLGLKQ